MVISIVEDDTDDEDLVVHILKDPTNTNGEPVEYVQSEVSDDEMIDQDESYSTVL